MTEEQLVCDSNSYEVARAVKFIKKIKSKIVSKEWKNCKAWTVSILGDENVFVRG